MKRRGPPQLVEDLVGGEYVRCAAGTFRMSHRIDQYDGMHWAILLDADLRETRTRIWLAPNTRLLEVLQPPEPTRVVGGESFDPLQTGGAT